MMQKKKSDVAHGAWNILRLALLRARKGGVLKNRLMMDLRLLPKFLKSLRHSTDHQRGALRYGERQLSFDDTPVLHVKMHRPSSLRFKMPHIPCINPHVDFDYDFDSSAYDDNDHEMYYDDDVPRRSFLNGADEVEENGWEEINGHCDEGIDLKAEQFIAKFYEQMKLQRQISYLQYNEMISRGTN